MKKLTLTMSLLAAGGLAALAPATARADDGTPDMYSYAWHDSRLASDYGIGVNLGGGVTGFTGHTMRDSVTSNVGGLWDLRVTLGSHTPLGVDVSYVGTAVNMRALIGPATGTLVGTTTEAALRWNILPHYDWNPYVFAGIGWQRYDMSGNSFTLSDTGIRNSDNSVEFPMGLGLGYRHESGFTADLRGTFRADTNNGLVLDSAGSTNFASMHTWEASGALGMEF